MRRISTIIMLICGVAVVGCSDDPQQTQGPPGVINETISQPVTPVGETDPDLASVHWYRSGGSSSDLGSSLEYRFHFDGPSNNATPWSRADSVLWTWLEPGVYSVTAEARSASNNAAVSNPSPPLTATVVVVPRTQITAVESRYWLGGQLMTELIDIFDAVPDTVPYGSWINVRYGGLDSGFDPTRCTDAIDKCFKYQMRYERTSARMPNFFFRPSYAPADPEDSTPNTVADSMSMNVGSLEYTVFARVTAAGGMPDPSPPFINIVGNYDPVLDGIGITNYDGTVINPGDTITFDFWSPPVDSVLFVRNAQLFTRKTFYFKVEALGHDHPKEQMGVQSWFYRFPRVADPSMEEAFGRANTWVAGNTPTTLDDRITLVIEYPAADVNGDEVFVNNPPLWHNVTYDYSIMGRDRPEIAQDFEQLMIYSGQRNTINIYDDGEVGRWTQEGSVRFHLRMVR